MSSTYPESFNFISARCEADGFDALDEKERVIYTIGWLETEVNNGGFYQYFWNSAGDHAEEALESLKRIGAEKTAALLEMAIRIIFDGQVPASRMVRQDILQQKEIQITAKLCGLDARFYQSDEDFYPMIDAYAGES